MYTKIKTELGSLNIDESVIANLAGIAAMESYGIVGMASNNAKDGLFKLLKTDSLSKGIKVYVNDTSVSIDMHVILEYGVKISEVSKNIIDRIKFTIENYTGFNVDKVNIFVQGIRTDK